MFVKLTTRYDTNIWMNLNQIVAIEPMNGGSMIYGTGAVEELVVKESPEQIIFLNEMLELPPDKRAKVNDFICSIKKEKKKEGPECSG